MSEPGSEYKVGYKKPPTATQFAKGTSGNPNGRPKGSMNLSTMFKTISSQMITMTENGRSRTVTKAEAVLQVLQKKALSGDLRAMKDYLRFQQMFEEPEVAEAGSRKSQEREAALLGSFLKRVQTMEEISDDTDTLDEPEEA